jgi:anti-sigma B factor antagonist
LGIDGAGEPGDNSAGPSTCYRTLLLTSNFDIESVWIDDAVVVKVSGDVDLLTAPMLSQELRRVRRMRIDVIVDLEEVEFMGCEALRVLLKAVTAAGPGQSRIGVTPGPPQVQKLFRLTGVDRILRIVPRSTDGYALVPCDPLTTPRGRDRWAFPEAADAA